MTEDAPLSENQAIRQTRKGRVNAEPVKHHRLALMKDSLNSMAMSGIGTMIMPENSLGHLIIRV